MLKQTLIAAGIMLAPCAAIAGPFEDGMIAFGRDNSVTAVKIWRPMAEQGDAAAQHMMGFMYQHGDGVPMDSAEAARWVRKAAEQGLAIAQNTLGLHYWHGMGVLRDYVQAYMWLNLAAAQGRDTSIRHRADIADHMTPAQIAEAQQRAREWLDNHLQ